LGGVPPISKVPQDWGIKGVEKWLINNLMYLCLTVRVGIGTISRYAILGRKTIYAVVETGGKQYKVSPGQTIEVEKLTASGDTVELDKVYLVADGDKVTVGNPTVPGAKVIANVVGNGKGDKVIVYKFKAKVRYRRKRGHRQPYTKLAIKEIVVG
jgi:large subunit ribosomal protein L21